MNEIIPYRFFRLSTPTATQNCIQTVQLVTQDTQNVWTVYLSTEQEKRSQAQNRLYWMWLGRLVKNKGHDVDDIHRFFKRHFLLNIYYRDDKGFADMCDAIRALRDTNHPKYNDIASEVINRTSTTTATVRQMNEYLSAIYSFCYSKGILLPIPQDEFMREERAVYQEIIKRQGKNDGN